MIGPAGCPVRPPMLPFMLVALLADLAAPPSAAKTPSKETHDVYFEQTTVVLKDGRASGPGVVSRVWYAGQRMRLEPGGATGGPALILRLDQGKAFRLDPERKRA